MPRRPSEPASERPTLEEIAELARVSLATASRVLNNKGNVAATKRRRVMEALADLSGSRTDAFRSLGLVVPDLENPFFSSIANQLALEVAGRPLRLLTSTSQGRADRELEAIRLLTDRGIDALVFVAAGGSDPEMVISLVSSFSDLPTVALDRAFANLDTVRVDGSSAMLDALSHLAELGHDQVGYVRGPAGTSTGLERFAAFQTAAANVGLTVDSAFIFGGDYSLDAGERAASRLIAMATDERPTALVCANDLMAIGAMRFLQRNGWLLPQDISIVGFDDVPQATWVTPTLSTIHQPIPQLVRTAVDVLSERLNAPRLSRTEDPVDVVLQGRYTARASVGAPNRRAGVAAATFSTKESRWAE